MNPLFEPQFQQRTGATDKTPTIVRVRVGEAFALAKASASAEAFP